MLSKTGIGTAWIPVQKIATNSQTFANSFVINLQWIYIKLIWIDDKLLMNQLWKHTNQWQILHKSIIKPSIKSAPIQIR